MRKTLNIGLVKIRIYIEIETVNNRKQLTIRLYPYHDWDYYQIAVDWTRYSKRRETIGSCHLTFYLNSRVNLWWSVMLLWIPSSVIVSIWYSFNLNANLEIKNNAINPYHSNSLHSFKLKIIKYRQTTVKAKILKLPIESVAYPGGAPPR